jgi:hypothetical protein
MVEPNLTPTLNIDCVGHGISNYRPLAGMLTKWLYLLMTFRAAEQIEIRVRHFDHRVLAEGAFLNRERELEPRIPGALQPQLLGFGLALVACNIQSLTFPGLAEHPAEDFGVRTLKIIFDIALADGLHWSVSHLALPRGLRYADPKAKHVVSLHPVRTAADMAYNLSTFRVKNGLPLQTCEVHVGDTLIRKVNGLDGPDAQMEWFPWETPHDPIFRREERHNLETGRCGRVQDKTKACRLFP